MKFQRTASRFAAVVVLGAGLSYVGPTLPVSALAPSAAVSSVASTLKCTGGDAFTQQLLDTLATQAVPPQPVPASLTINTTTSVNIPNPTPALNESQLISFTPSVNLPADLTDLAAKAGITQITVQDVHIFASVTGPATVNPDISNVAVPGTFTIDLTAVPITPPGFPPQSVNVTATAAEEIDLNLNKVDLTAIINLGATVLTLKLTCPTQTGATLAVIAPAGATTTAPTAVAGATASSTAAPVAGSTNYAG